MKLWFGPTSKRFVVYELLVSSANEWFFSSKWLRSIRPANMKYYAEFFYNQYRTLIANNWRDTAARYERLSRFCQFSRLAFPTVLETSKARTRGRTSQEPSAWRQAPLSRHMAGDSGYAKCAWVL